MSLVDAADNARDRTIGTLLELRQRLLQSGPANEMSRMSIGSRTHSASMSQVSQTSGQTPVPPDQTPSNRQFMKHRRTLTPEMTPSGYASNAEDTASGAEDNQKKQVPRNRNRSLFGFLGHHRTHSSEQVPKSQDEPARQTPNPAADTVPYNPPKQYEDSISTRSGSTAKAPSSYDDSTSVRSGSISGSGPKFTYEEGNDAWSAKAPAGPERRDTQVAPDNMPGMSRQPTWNSVTPSALSMVRTFSNTGSVAPAGYSSGSIAVPHPSAENSYLGFCKGAWRLQNGDRKGLAKCKDYMYSAQSGVYYLACSASKCAFAGHYNPKVIWDKVWVDKSKGLKFRWPFLAKSHVAQKTVTQNQYSYQCLFCVYLGNTSPVMHGMELYLEHISQEHRGHNISEVVLYKCGAVNDREAEDSEEFDINLFPLSVEEFAKRKEGGALLSDDLMSPDRKRSDTIAKDSMFSNEPWNAGLSDFHYGGNNEYDFIGRNTSMYDRDFESHELEG